VSAAPRTVILDNYDSFTWNLFQLAAELCDGVEPRVFRNDAITLPGLRALAPERIIISPGPGSPVDPAYFGVCRDVILELGPTVPVLGVCLGHIGIIHAFGGEIARAPEPRHGKTSLVLHDHCGVFGHLPEPLEVMRYHSLIGVRATLPPCLGVTAWTDEGLVMGVRHQEHPIEGVQFHPESIGTEYGRQMLWSFLRGDMSINLVDRDV
jgi:anthranilate synthase/aminodeoxychorismate synthase-like glutamine amidotransferase